MYNADNTACTEFMQFVITNGNFGRKGGHAQRVSVQLGNNDESKEGAFLVRTLKQLQKAGLSAWEWDVEHRDDEHKNIKLKPIKGLAWCYLPIRYVKKMLTGKRSIKETRELMKEVKENKGLRDKLGIYDNGNS